MQIIEGGVTAAAGFQAGGTVAGIKKNGKPDLAIVFSECPAVAAGVFTTNQVKAAPVVLSQQQLVSGFARAVVLNSGNANACMGEQGMQAAQEMANATAKCLQIEPPTVLVASTGVIGVPLPVEKISAVLSQPASWVSKAGYQAAATAIMTTDTFVKEIAVELEVAGVKVHIGGMAKGSGMIHPNMATMLGVITTDLDIEHALLQQALIRATEVSFNRVTVDGDTSTNDCLFVLANGLADNPKITEVNQAYQEFLAGLIFVAQELAKMLARDGEGATKFVEIKVSGAASEAAATQIAKSVATSSLVKTALFGEDANWGRILAAVGYAGVEFDPMNTNIYLGDLLVCQGGVGLAFDEAIAKEILSKKEILIRIEVGHGLGNAVVWTCDLSYDYVKINGDYRT